MKISMKLPIKLPIILLLAVVQVVDADQELSFETIFRDKVVRETVVRYREAVSGNLIEVAIHQRKFDFSNYKLTGGVLGSEPYEHAKIDGVEVAGTDSKSPAGNPGWPNIETIAEIDLKWNGKPIEVPKLLHINLLNLGLDKDMIQFVPKPDGEELLIQAKGGDGGASYYVSLVLRRNGKHKQYDIMGGDFLPSFPYCISEVVGMKDGLLIIEKTPWLESKADSKNLPELPTSKPPIK